MRQYKLPKAKPLNFIYLILFYLIIDKPLKNIECDYMQDTCHTQPDLEPQSS